MMKKLCLFAIMLCFAALLSGCTGRSVPSVVTTQLTASLATEVPGVETILPEVVDNEPMRSTDEAVLYFRFLQEPYLAQEFRAINRTASQSYEMELITELLKGPGTVSTELNGLFPDGTRVLSTVRQGRTLFVTFSEELMNAYPDEPVDWQEHAAWRQEVPLRRKLCIQSLIATVTENCDVDQVQVLVQNERAAQTSLRLKQCYFQDDSEEDVLVGPMIRDNSLLLNAENSLKVILTCWSRQDWKRMYQFMPIRDPATGEGRISDYELIEYMMSLPSLVSFESDGYTLSADGNCATFPIRVKLLNTDGSVSTADGKILRLYRMNGVWKTGLSDLTGWLEVRR